jgi:O-antigen ligase
VLARSTHQSSQLALVIGAVTLIVATWSRRVAAGTLVAGWLAASMLMVPAAIAAHGLELQRAPWLFNSARHRVVIWNYTAEEVLKRPLIGVGADATGVLHEGRIQRGEVRSTTDALPIGTARHAHNAYLQIWYELGLIGALLLAGLGLLLVRLAMGLAGSAAPLALASFATVAGMLATSYGLWQPWLLAGLALAALMLAAAARLEPLEAATTSTREEEARRS